MSDVDAYPRHGGQLKQIAKSFGIPTSELLDFSANINPSGPPAGVAVALRKGMDDISTLITYPDLESTELKDSIADYLGVNSQRIVVANGFVPLLEAALRTLSVRRCLLPVPAFVEYRRTLERIGVETTLHLLPAETSFGYDLSEILGTRLDAILLANPQNPSGVCHKPLLMCKLVEKAYKNDTYVLLDEAFVDYIPDQSLVDMTAHFPNLVVFRSVTKFHAIPGLRVAYAVSNGSLASLIGESLPPWPITTLASRAVIAALADEAYALRSREENRVRKMRLEHELRSLDLILYPAVANFLLLQLPLEVNPHEFWRHMISEHKIVIRSCANYDGLSDWHFRVAVRTPEENSRLVAAISASLPLLKTRVR